MSDQLTARAKLVAQDIRNQRERLHAACISSDGWSVMVDELAAQLAATHAAAQEMAKEYHALLNEPMYAGTRADWIHRAQAAEAKVDATHAAIRALPLEKMLRDMQHASAQIDDAKDGTAYQLGLVSLALMARHFLRECAPGLARLLGEEKANG